MYERPFYYFTKFPSCIWENYNEDLDKAIERLQKEVLKKRGLENE